MNLLRDRGFRRVPPPSSPVDGIATVAIGLLLAIAVVMIVVVLLVAGAVTSWLREQPPATRVSMPVVLQFAERGL